MIRRFYIKKKSNSFSWFFGCVGLGFLIEFTLRGIGYFSFTQYLFFAAAMCRFSPDQKP